VNESLSQLAVRIRDELFEVERVLGRLEEGWQRARSTGDEYYLDGVALNLHGFYTGMEGVFERIASVVDGRVPQGENWHRTLLLQMAEEVPGVRPAVISTDAREFLDEYRAFRHVARKIYTFYLDPAKVEPLVQAARVRFDRVRLEVLAFADFLEEAAAEDG
jgi:hypothetical protein